VTVRATCPARAAQDCAGKATLARAARSVAYRLAPGSTGLLRFRLTAAARRALARAGTLMLDVSAVNDDPSGGTRSFIGMTVRI
jgi:hypothetical protein